MKFFLSILAAAVLATSEADALSSPAYRRLEEANSGAKRSWWQLGLADDILNEVGLYYLGQAWYGSADVGEVLETISRVNASDPWSWTMQWRKTAERLEALAIESANAGHHRSAGHFYLRAATYRRAALHRHPDPYQEEVPIQAKLAVNNFKMFLTEFDYPCKAVAIPYEDTSLPGYLCINPSISGPAPTIIFQEGKDGWAEDGKFVVDESLPRGYNVLLFDGPGMGQVIRLQGLPFRHDWEKVLTPVVDYLIDIDEVDENNIALVAMSLGGYLGPRAAAFEHRLKAMVVNTGVLDWGEVYRDFLSEIDPNLITLYKTETEAFDAAINQYMEFAPVLEWGMVDSMWHHNKTTPSELMAEIELFNNKDIAKDIKSRTLIIDADSETRGQPVELYDSLVNCPEKAYIKFTAEEAAQFHCQPGAIAIMSARMFNWLDEILENTDLTIKSFASLSHSALLGHVCIGLAVTTLGILSLM